MDGQVLKILLFTAGVWLLSSRQQSLCDTSISGVLADFRHVPRSLKSMDISARPWYGRQEMCFWVFAAIVERADGVLNRIEPELIASVFIWMRWPPARACLLYSSLSSHVAICTMWDQICPGPSVDVAPFMFVALLVPLV
jgi:hypothetical protein